MAGLDAEAGNLGGETAADATTAGPPALAGAAGVDALATGEAAVGEAAVGEATVGALAVALNALAGAVGKATAEADEAGGLALLAAGAAPADIVAVARRAERALAPLGAEGGSPPLVGVDLAAGRVDGGATADLLLAGTVVDLKVTATTQTRLRDLHRVVVLALLDTDDDRGITHVGLAPVRFGVLVRWELAPLLADLAGTAIDLEGLRVDLRDHLGRAASA